MKKLAFLIPAFALLLASCEKMDNSSKNREMSETKGGNADMRGDAQDNAGETERR